MSDATANLNHRGTFLFSLLKATSQNEDIYPHLRNNLNKLNNEFASELRKFGTDHFTKQPTQAANTARIIVKFSKRIQEFDVSSS
ncbi:TPR repeat-containing protein [Calothrix sp. NIES-4071]|nr:TPR repeat-containing protein [Calothrix sp. NIES-4071]BAZ60588.1 TPR repeat-containing protein [Calothrix sp. NIES-4105]